MPSLVLPISGLHLGEGGHDLQQAPPGRRAGVQRLLEVELDGDPEG